MTIAALIVAAGRGTRAATANSQPKQYTVIGGKPMLAYAIKSLSAHPEINTVTVVIHPDDQAAYEQAIASAPTEKLTAPVAGGATRQASVLCGLEAISEAQTKTDRVLIHDAARPFVSTAVIDGVINALKKNDGALPALPLADTLKRTNPKGLITETLPRADLWRAQTPQGFQLIQILDAHRKAAEQTAQEFTDDAAIAEWAGMKVVVTPGSRDNEKITTAEDLALSKLTNVNEPAFETRVGTGFDVHKFAAGSSVWLCGVEIPHDQRLDGHSDADVGLHALTDAILGAIGDGDIGQHFPPTDPQWKGAASHLFLRDASRRVADRNGRIVNTDITLLCEAPKIGPHRDAMRAAVAEILGIEIARVGVKATTTEGLGFTGRREGIAAMASASILLPVETLPT
ncbi:MAG: bifunctional 2-C-methyl-D-erythritol 4-phosphate cytidylyltransferase/2-C-methyl-D-erythritol 2,4-cyclodiphosphate synthase [Filomicrobium sp.]